MKNFWPTCLSRFEQELSTQQFNTWIKPLYAEVDGATVRIIAPNRFVMQWVKDRFIKKIEQFAHELQHKNIQIEFVISNNDSESDLKTLIKTNTESKEHLVESLKKLPSTLSKSTIKTINHAPKINSGLNSTFNFGNYVTGRANQLARAAAIQVAENPGTAYNPLFIYGGVGLGKTHLLQAIGNELKQNNPDAKIRYLHAERYVSDVVKAYEHKAFDEFKRQYHSLDLLLIDDIQFFAKKNTYTRRVFLCF